VETPENQRPVERIKEKPEKIAGYPVGCGRYYKTKGFLKGDYSPRPRIEQTLEPRGIARRGKSCSCPYPSGPQRDA